MIAARTGIGAAGACALLALTGCTAAPRVGPTTYVTVVVPPRSSRTAALTRTSPSSTVPVMRRLPGDCPGRLPLGRVIDALGAPVNGGTAFVLGTADPSIARVSYLNCRYGVSNSTATAQIEIGVNLYRTAAKAEARLKPTVHDYTRRGATTARVVVAGWPATVLTGGTGAGYGPTLVMAIGQRTIAVTLRRGSVPADQVTQDLAALAGLAARRTA
jgi:hypothetical protein